jgi:transposase
MAAIPTVEEEDSKRPNREAEKNLAGLRITEGVALPENTRAGLHRDMARLRVVRDQIKEIEQEQIAPNGGEKVYQSG